jgi:hypothetical protein
MIISLIIYCLFVFTLLSLLPSFSNNSVVSALPEEILRLKANYTARSKLAADANRYDMVEKMLKRGAGVYKTENELHVKYPKLKKTVLIAMIQYGNKQENAHYKIYFKNFLCFLRHYQMKMVVYIAHHAIANVTAELQELEMDYGVLPLTYPDELFWQLLSTKDSFINRGRGFAEYDLGSYPSFRHFGALVMLVPVLEALQHEYDVIFVDVDVALILDPIPYLLPTTAAWSLSQESRQCQEHYSLDAPELFDWMNIEPNTGFMYLRHAHATTAFTRFLKRIVDYNYNNDQRAFDRKALQLYFEADCNLYFTDNDDIDDIDDIEEKQPINNHHPHNHHNHHNHSHQNRSFPLPLHMRQSHLNQTSFCLFSELLYENGIIGIGCPLKKQFRDDYVIALSKHGFLPTNQTVLSLMNPHARFPVTLHANYANKKTHELQVRGLWLVREETQQMLSNDPLIFCKEYEIHKTYYGAHNWTQELSEIAERQSNIKAQLHDGVPIKTLSDATVYRLELVNTTSTSSPSQSQPRTMLVRRMIPNGATFVKIFGEDAWGRVVTVPTKYMHNIPQAEPLPALG